MPAGALLAVIALLTAASAHAADLRTEWKAGQKAYRAESFADAAAHYQAARKLAEAAEQDPAELDLNLGSSQFRAGNLEEAENAFELATRTADLAVQADAYYNLGCVRLARGKLVLEEQQAKAADEQFALAMEAFQRSLRVRSDDLDAKVNFELTLLERQKLRGYVLAVRDRIAASDDLVAQRRYEEALQMLSEQDDSLAMAADLDPEVKQALEQRQQRAGQLVQLIQQLQQGEAGSPEVSP